MSTSKLANYTKCLLVISMTWVLSFIAVECIFRILGDRPNEDIKGFFIQFINGSYKLAPNIDFSSQWVSGPFSVHTDGLGLRCDADRKYAVSEGEVLDLLFIGDSQGFGNGVVFEDTIAGAVAVLAEEQGVRAANASVGGHSLRNQLELIRWLYKQQGIRVSHYVILLTPMMLTASDSFNQALVGHDGRLYDKKKNVIGMAKIWLKTHLVTYSRIRDAIRHLGIGIDPSGAVPFVFRLFDTSSDEEQAAQKLENCVNEFRDLAAEQDATLWVVYVPLTIELDFSSVQKAAEAKGIHLDPYLPMRICTTSMRKARIPVFNLRTVLDIAHSQGQRLHLKADFHYDAELSRACARYLWQEIKPSVISKSNHMRSYKE